MYNYTVLQEVKESLYSYNEEQISRDLMNYIFAVNFDIGAVEICEFTGDKLEITEGFFRKMESRLQIEPDRNRAHSETVSRNPIPLPLCRRKCCATVCQLPKPRSIFIFMKNAP